MKTLLTPALSLTHSLSHRLFGLLRHILLILLQGFCFNGPKPGAFASRVVRRRATELEARSVNNGKLQF
jgi:hypothetical protein